jgi:holo-[acyl-carrier protein] synthase
VILLTGVDMVDVSELSRMVELTGDEFLESSWTSAERLYCAGRVEQLASRWAAKEAAMKVLGHGVGKISPLDIEVAATEGERPSLLLRGKASLRARQLGLDTWSVSLTHAGQWALAFVIGIGRGGDGHR